MENACDSGLPFGLWLLLAPLIFALWMMAAGLAIIGWRLFIDPGMGDGKIR